MIKDIHSTNTCQIDVAEWLSRAGLEMISRAGFGHSFHAFEGDGDDYARAVKAIAYVGFHFSASSTMMLIHNW